MSPFNQAFKKCTADMQGCIYCFFPSPIPAMLMKAQHSWDFQICYHCGEVEVGPCALHGRIEHWALVIFVMLCCRVENKEVSAVCWAGFESTLNCWGTVLGGWKEQVLLPGILLGLFKMSLMYIAVVSEDLERKLLRKMAWSNVTASEFISIGMRKACP